MIAELHSWVNGAVDDLHNLLRTPAVIWSLTAQGVFIALALAWLGLFGARLRTTLEIKAKLHGSGPTYHVLSAFARAAPWIVFFLVMMIGRVAFHEAGWRARFLHLAESLALAWVVIRLTSRLVGNQSVAAAIAIGAWIFAALNILGLTEQTLSMLDSVSVMIGHFRLSALVVFKGAFLLVVLLWIANTASRLLEHRLQAFPTLAPATQVLAAKLAKVLLLGLAMVIALNAVGIDLTAFAVLSGAIGVGVGFGLQKVVSNLISGVILLLDRSIKPGDVIEIAGTYGWITRLNARFVSVSTRDGIEHLIPNEDLITQRVTNWSYTNDLVRQHVQVGIGYDSDVRKAMALCIEAAESVRRVLNTHTPICLIKGFGENAVELEVRFWIQDPRNGTANVRSEVMLGIWDRFREHGIVFPAPQRDIHLKDAGDLAAKISTILSNAAAPGDDAAGPGDNDFRLGAATSL